MSEAESAFAVLVAEVADPVRRYLWRRTDPATADDVLSETLIVLWRRFEDVPPEVVPWAIGVARLQLRNAERSIRRQGLLQARIRALDPPRESVAGPDAADDGDEAVRVAVGLLSSADQELLRLAAWEELTTAQVAAVLGITPNAAAIRLHRARKRFKSLWRKTDPVAGHAAVKTKEQS